MDDAREFQGRDVEEAIASAARELGVPAQSLRWEVVEEGRKGLFGLGSRQVRIRVRVEDEPRRAAAPPPSTPSGASEPTGAPPGLEDVVRRILGLIGLDVSVQAAAGDGAVRIDLAGPDRRALTRNDGELLTALQFLLNRMARRSWPDAGHIQIRCEGYRNQQEEELVELAREVARQVARTGRSKRLHSMNPYERRLVHLTVREFPELTTRSEGSGFLKKVTVAPATPAGPGGATGASA